MLAELEPTTKAAKSACAHHWLIEEVAGATSAGRCKLCGERRDFYNHIEDAIQAQEEARARAAAESQS